MGGKKITGNQKWTSWHLEHGQIKWKIHELSGSKLLMNWSHIKRMICRLVESKGRSRLMGGTQFQCRL